MPKLDDGKLKALAYMIGEEGISQVEAAARLEVSPATINRGVREAEARNWIVRSVQCGLTAKEIRRARALFRHGDLLQHLNTRSSKNLVEVRVFDCGARRFEDRLVEFSSAAGSYLRRCLVAKKVKRVGVSWGVTLRSVIQALRNGQNSPRSEDPVTCFPVAGAPPDAVFSGTRSAAFLREELTKALNGSDQSIGSFSIGAWIPNDFKEEEADVIRRYHFTHPGYSEVFCEDGLLSKADSILTSAGSSEEFAGLWLESAAKAGGVSTSVMSRATVGNLSGVFLPKPDATKKHVELVREVNSRWTGVSEDDLRRCASSAFVRETPGVVVFALGEFKAPLILEALKRGLINRLVIDDRLAEALRKG